MVHGLLAHCVGRSPDKHLLAMATGVHLTLATEKCELIVRGVYGAGKTAASPLLFTLRSLVVRSF